MASSTRMPRVRDLDRVCVLGPCEHSTRAGDFGRTAETIHSFPPQPLMRLWQYSIDSFLGMPHQLICHKASRNRTSEGEFSSLFVTRRSGWVLPEKKGRRGLDPLFPRLLFFSKLRASPVEPSERASGVPVGRAVNPLAVTAAAAAPSLLFSSPLSMAVVEGHPERERELSPELSMDSLGRLLGDE